MQCHFLGPQRIHNASTTSSNLGGLISTMYTVSMWLGMDMCTMSLNQSRRANIIVLSSQQSEHSISTCSGCTLKSA